MFHCFQCMIHHYPISAYLFTGETMVYPSEFMRTLDHLKTTICFVRFRQRYHYTHQLIRKKELIFIPISIILVPFPGASHFWFLLHQFGMEVADRTFAVK